MDVKAQLSSEFSQIGVMTRVVAECRVMANKLGLIISWTIDEQTATAYLKYNGHTLWKADFTDNMPHLILCRMYAGVYIELERRQEKNRISILRMRQIEVERERERRMSMMPDWQERRNKSG